VDQGDVMLVETGKQSGIIQFVYLGLWRWFHDLWHGFPILSIHATCYVHVHVHVVHLYWYVHSEYY
jgi:hypothetical protein